jgi:hypothetical protein
MGNLVDLSDFFVYDTLAVFMILWIYWSLVLFYILYIIRIFFKMHVDIGPYPIEEIEERKTDITIDSYDLWNLDQTLATIIHPCLIAFKVDMNSYPDDFSTIEDWGDAIDKMIYSFAAYKDGTEVNTLGGGMLKYQEGINLFAKYFSHLWN